MKKILAFVAVLLLCANIALAQTVQLDIYSVNDWHGHLRADELNPGAPKLAGVLNALAAENPAGTIVVGAGDMLSGSIDADEFEGLNVVQALNAMGFAADCAGNHAFDYDMEVIRRQAQAAEFPVLAANIIDAEGKIPAPFKPYALVERGGIKIGLIGVLDAGAFKKVKPDFVQGLMLTDPAAAANKYAAQLRRQGAQVVVLLAHIGVAQANGALQGALVPLLPRLQGIDAVASGDSHTLAAAVQNGVPVVQAGEYGKFIGHIRLLYDAEKAQVTTATARFIDVCAAEAEADNKMAALLQPYFDAVDVKYDRVLAYNRRFLSNEKYGASPLADYFMSLLQTELKADIAFYNGGGVRSSLPRGAVTLRALKQVFPFNNTLYVVKLRGSDVMAALEHGLGSREYGRLRFAGLTVTADLDAAQGQKIKSVRLADGKPLQMDDYYSVVLNDFLLAGGDGCVMFKDAPIIRTAGSDMEIFVQGLAQAGVINFGGDGRLLLQ